FAGGHRPRGRGGRDPGGVTSVSVPEVSRPSGTGTHWMSTRTERTPLMSAVDKAKNAVEDVEGKAKEALGRLSGDRSTENEGRKDQAKADLKDAGEKVKDAFGH